MLEDLSQEPQVYCKFRLLTSTKQNHAPRNSTNSCQRTEFLKNLVSRTEVQQVSQAKILRARRRGEGRAVDGSTARRRCRSLPGANRVRAIRRVGLSGPGRAGECVLGIRPAREKTSWLVAGCTYAVEQRVVDVVESNATFWVGGSVRGFGTRDDSCGAERCRNLVSSKLLIPIILFTS
jgi:hypothetical protein